MAQPTTAKLEYLGTVQVVAGTEYAASAFATGAFVGATSFIMKSKGRLVNGTREEITVSINNTPLFPIEYNESTAFDVARTPALKFKFNQDCIVLICKELALVL